MKKILSILLVLIMLFSLVACNSGKDLVGIWENEDTGYTYVFSDKGTGRLDGISFTYQTKGSRLIITYNIEGVNSNPVEYKYKVKDNLLTFTDIFESQVTYQKVSD